MVLTTPVEMHTTISAKNAHALVHERICNGAEAFYAMEVIANLS